MKKLNSITKDLNGFRSVRDVATLYFPSYRDKNSAILAFQECINQNPQMLMELEKVNYNIKNKFLSPAMIKIIVQHCGLPDAVENYVMNANDKKND